MGFIFLADPEYPLLSIKNSYANRLEPSGKPTLFHNIEDTRSQHNGVFHKERYLMTAFRKSFSVKKRDFVRAGEASINIQNILKSLNMDQKMIRRIAICGYEGEMNIVMHGGDGILTFEIDTGKIILDISDNGDGIENIELAMQKGYSTATEEHREMGFGAGMGLPNMKANSDIIEIESVKGEGTHVHLEFNVSSD